MEHKMQKERDHSIDIVKALMIISVVWFHMRTILSGSCDLSHPVFETLYLAHKSYALFFMPAFFMVTGYCSNYQRPFKEFLLANVKGIVVHMIILNLIPCLLTFSMDGVGYMFSLHNWLYGLSFWFLPVLFLSKIIYWTVCHYTHSWWMTMLVVFLAFTAAIFFTRYTHLPDYWYWKNALAYMFFIWFGHQFRKIENQNIWFWIGAGLYLLALVLVGCFSLTVWYLGLPITCTFQQMPFYLIASTSGCLLILGIARLIRKNSVLEYIGRASLVIYCTHWFIAQHLGKYLARVWTPDTDMAALFFYIIMIAITIVCCCAFYYFYDNRYLRRITH